jgi:hypothetical protein
VFLAVILFLVTETSFAARTNLLLNGDVSPVESPLSFWFGTDFTVTYSMIPTNDQMLDPGTAQRYIRLYAPRTMGQMMEFDAIFHIESGFFSFTPNQLKLFEEAHFSEGVAAICSPPYDEPFLSSWTNTFLIDMVPHDFLPEIGSENVVIQGGSWTVSFVRDRGLPPVLTMFEGYDLERVIGTMHRPIYPKPGVTIWAEMVGAVDPGNRERPPFMISWSWGKGMVWALSHDYDLDWWGVERGLFAWDDRVNPVSPDIVLNIIYHSTGRQLPEDIVLIHSIREEYRSLSTARESIVSLLDFVQKFGANVNRLDGGFEEVREIVRRGESSYEDGYYAESLRAFEDASAQYSRLSNQAMRLKDEALVWIYVIEWSAVLGTLMIAGSALYALMIRRILYSDVNLTKARRA